MKDPRHNLISLNQKGLIGVTKMNLSLKSATEYLQLSLVPSEIAYVFKKDDLFINAPYFIFM